MTKKKQSSPAGNTRRKGSKGPHKPLWMRIIRLLAIILAATVMILAIIGMLRTYFHLISH